MRIHDKFFINIDHYVDKKAKIVAIISWTKNKIIDHIIVRRQSLKNIGYFKISSMILKLLISVFENKHKTIKNRRKFKKLIMKPIDSFAEFFSTFFLLVNQMPNMSESEKIQKFNEKIITELRLTTANNKSFDTLNDYKVHLKKTELNINYFNNRKISITSQIKIFSSKVYARFAALPKLFKRATMPGRTKPKNKLKSKAFGNIFARKNQKSDEKKKC